MKNKILFAVFIFLCSIFLLPKEDPWGDLKKIHFYDSVKNYRQVLEQLELIQFEDLNRADQKEIASQLIRFGDHYFEKGKYDHAEAFYRKVFNVAPKDDYWYLYNKLEKINRVNGSIFIGFKSLFGQLFLALENFKASFLLVNNFFNLLFFSALFTFLLFSLLLFIKYFKLAGNDLFLDAKKKLSIKKVFIVLLVLLWPALLLFGWMIYPFLLAGFLWFYMNENEKKAVKYMLIAVAVITALYSLNLLLEKNLQTNSFKQAQKVYEGHLFDKEVYDTFDDALKVAQAASYYEKGKIDPNSLNTALDILNSTNDDYKSPLKYTLKGNIYFKYGEIGQSIKYYSDSLLLDDDNKVTLNNFTLALSKENKPEVFNSYAERYPQIKSLRAKAVDIKNVKLNQGALWERLFNSPKGNFNPGLLFKGIIKELFKLPVVYYMLLLMIYIMGLKRLVPLIGQSTYCSKCHKIIKEASIHKSYKLCDDCYQLFSIKDVIFLEAKILKEKELRKKYKKKYIVSLIFSLFIPGLNFNYRGNNRLFLLLSVIFYFLVGFAVVGMVNFNRIYSAAPLFLNLVGIAAVGFYLLVNIFSVLGDENGF
jgi:tetratricopeptide (TPR) repeat protein